MDTTLLSSMVGVPFSQTFDFFFDCLLTVNSVGLQIVPDWQTFFHNPRGTALGLINSAQNVGALLVSVLAFNQLSF